MPVDPAKLRRVADHNDQVTEGIKTMSNQLQRLDPTKPEETSAVARAWAQSVRELKVSLEEQRELSKEMRVSARIQDEQQSDSFRDKFRFLVGRLTSDIRGLFAALPEFVDLPQDFSNQKTWDHCVFDMENDIKHLSAVNAGDTSLLNVDPIVTLLNYRDRVVSLLLAGVLFQASVLHWDLKSERAYADGPMVQMAEQVVHIYSKTESLPYKYRLAPTETLPATVDPGPFTYQAKQKGEKSGTSAADVTSVQYRLLTVLREMQSLDAGLRNLQSSLQVHITDKLSSSGDIAAAADLQREAQKWFDRCQRLEQELSNSKEKRQTGFEMEVEQLTARCAEKDRRNEKKPPRKKKTAVRNTPLCSLFVRFTSFFLPTDQLNKKEITRIHKMESDMQGWKYELASLRREKSELAEKNAKMAKENLPVIDRLLTKSREAVERLAKDSEVLSRVFRLQGQEKKRALAQYDETSLELERLRGQLAEVRECIKVKEGQLERKETLYLRTMAARKCIHEAYLEEKQKIMEAEDKMRQRDAEWQEMLKVLEGRDSEIRQMQDDLNRAQHRIKELQKQQVLCMQAFTKATGRPGKDLLACFKPTPTLPLP